MFLLPIAIESDCESTDTATEQQPEDATNHDEHNAGEHGIDDMGQEQEPVDDEFGGTEFVEEDFEQAMDDGQEQELVDDEDPSDDDDEEPRANMGKRRRPARF